MVNDVGEVQNLFSQFPANIWNGKSSDQRDLAIRNPSGYEWLQSVREIQAVQQYAFNLAGLFDKPEIPIVAGTTLPLLGRYYACDATTNYTVNLPALVLGQMIGIRVTGTALVTISSSSAIGKDFFGSSIYSRIMQPGESATLIGTPTGWAKTGGHTTAIYKQLKCSRFTLAASGTVPLIDYFTMPGWAGAGIAMYRGSMYNMQLAFNCGNLGGLSSVVPVTVNVAGTYPTTFYIPANVADYVTASIFTATYLNGTPYTVTYTATIGGGTPSLGMDLILKENVIW